MFEAAQGQKQSNTSHILITVLVVIAAATGVFYTSSKNSGKSAPPVTGATAATAAAGKADPVHDLKILNARMEKDRSGTTAVWLVDIDNKSKTYSYSSI